MNDREQIAREQEVQRAKVEATDPLVKSAVLNVWFDPDDKVPFAPWRYQLTVMGGGLLEGRGQTLIQCSVRATDRLSQLSGEES